MRIGEVERHPDRDLIPLQRFRRGELAGDHPYHLERRPVQGNCPADDGGVTPPAALPDTVTQQRHLGCARQEIVRSQHSPKRGRTAQDDEELAGHFAGGKPLRRAVVGEVLLHAEQCRERTERRRTFPYVHEIGNGNGSTQLGERDELFRTIIGQRAQQDVVHHAEDRCRGPHPERNDGDRGE